MPKYFEFFAGGGMARAGLGKRWTCLFANDIDTKKARAYRANWGGEELLVEDVSALTTRKLPGQPDLAWASFPCQDLSLAGVGAGLKGERSGTFWPFWKLMLALQKEKRAPKIVVLENVCGALTSHDGKDFAAIAEALTKGGYRFGAVVMDAINFLPQSRPRLFLIGMKKELPTPVALLRSQPAIEWHPESLTQAYSRLSKAAQAAWVWWKLPAPPRRKTIFADLIEEQPQGVAWHSAEETRRLLQMMSPLHLDKVKEAKALKRRIVGCIYKRTRRDAEGNRRVRAEVRFDDIAGCLRTPAGGSSRQTILLVEGRKVRSRLLSPRESARLMGLPERYLLPQKYNEAYHLTGDGVVVPVVRFLAKHLLEPLVAASQ